MHALWGRSGIDLNRFAKVLRKRERWYSLPFCCLIFSLLVAGCTPPAGLPTPMVDNGLTMVAVDKLPATAILTDTLLLARVVDKQALTATIVLGPRSAFATLPSSAVALFDKSHIPAGATILGTVDITSPDPLAPDQVVVVAEGPNVSMTMPTQSPTPSNLSTPPPTIDVSIRPESALKWMETSATFEPSAALPKEFVIQFRGVGPQADCQDDPWACVCRFVRWCFPQ